MKKIDGVYQTNEGPWSWGAAAFDPAHHTQRTRARADFYADAEAAADEVLCELQAAAAACGAELVSDGRHSAMRMVIGENDDGTRRQVQQELWSGKLWLLVRDGAVGSRAAVLLRESATLLRSEPIAATVEA